MTGENGGPDAGRPPWLDAPVPDPYPYEETHDLRVGPNLHPALLGLLPFVGVWRGRGGGEYPTIEPFEYAQEIRFSHDGRKPSQSIDVSVVNASPVPVALPVLAAPPATPPAPGLVTIARTPALPTSPHRHARKQEPPARPSRVNPRPSGLP